MKVLGVIPARGGSKGVPKKNVKLLGGKPLIAYSIEAARAAKRLTRVIVSTDDEEIAEVSRRWGADAPFLRPAELATDAAKAVPV
ncbi:MAG: acylneuraminate cytidylyltransferase family protein, partial [Saprospiraceae bacterium]|nr:acylneuraminate cytidylyltransferase family protein [Saprospiraceae bacterium]